MQEYRNEKKLLLRITCICWILAKWISIHVWTAGRLMPTVAMFEFLDKVPPVTHQILSIISIILIAAIAINNKSRILLLSLLLIETALCCLDMSRWQPWEYQYLFIVFVTFINFHQPKYILPAITLILCCTYFYSGLAKLNEGFLQGTWSLMILKGFLKIKPHLLGLKSLHLAGYLVGIMELLAGICLLFFKTRKPAAKFLIVMHFFILLLLGPVGLNYNMSVWPWNLAMILYLFLLYRKSEKILPMPVALRGWNRVVLLCWGILPALNLLGYWDNYFSSNIYSGKLPRMNVCIADTSKALPLMQFKRKAGVQYRCGGQAMIDIQDWAMKELAVPVYPELRTYRRIQTKLKKQYPDAGFKFVYFVNTRDRTGHISE